MEAIPGGGAPYGRGIPDTESEDISSEPSPALLKLAFVAAAIAAARAAAAAGESRLKVAVLAGETIAPGG